MSNIKVTDEQIREALAETNGNITHTAEKLDVTRTGLQRRIKRMRGRGFEVPQVAPTVFPIVPAGQILKGVSSLQKVQLENGETVMQWVKTMRDPSTDEANAALEALRSELPKYEPVDAQPRLSNASLCSVVTITDFHMGMYSWAEETGDDWDMNIAEELLVKWFEMALASCPDSAMGVLAQLGDFLHYDSLEAVTPTSRNQLDADSRAQKMIRVALRVLRRVINMMLDKFPIVTVLMAEGNHDIVSSAWLREAFKMIYENEKRVTIITSPDPYYAVQWGRTGLFWHHGHLKKMEQLDRVFARKFREIYGSCTHCYGHAGHLHHERKLETPLMHVEQHPTLASSDAHASRHGYMSDRSAKVITYHKEYGEVGTVQINPEMVKAGFGPL